MSESIPPSAHVETQSPYYDNVTVVMKQISEQELELKPNAAYAPIQ